MTAALKAVLAVGVIVGWVVLLIWVSTAVAGMVVERAALRSCTVTEAGKAVC